MRAQAPTAPTALSASSTPMCTAPALRPHHHHLLCYCPHLAALGSVSAIVPPGCPSVRPPPLPSALCPPILRRHHPPSPHLAALGSVSAIVPWLGFSVILEASKASNVSPPPPLPSPPPPPPPPSALCPPPTTPATLRRHHHHPLPPAHRLHSSAIVHLAALAAPTPTSPPQTLSAPTALSALPTHSTSSPPSLTAPTAPHHCSGLCHCPDLAALGSGFQISKGFPSSTPTPPTLCPSTHSTSLPPAHRLHSFAIVPTWPPLVLSLPLPPPGCLWFGFSSLFGIFFEASNVSPGCPWFGFSSLRSIWNY